MRQISRRHVETWIDDWSHTDRELVRQALDLLPLDCAYYLGANDSQITVKSNGRRVFLVSPGYVEWPKAEDVPGLDLKLSARGELYRYESQGGGVGVILSTFKRRGDATATVARDYGVCPIHFIALPTTGLCSDC